MARFAAGSWDDVDLFVTVVLSGKSDPLAVRGEFPEDFDAWMRRQTQCGADAGRRGPKVAGVSEDDAVAANVRGPQEFRLRIRADRKDNNAGEGLMILSKQGNLQEYPQVC